MDRTLILDKLQQLTAGLRPAPGTNTGDLPALQRSLAEQLAADPDFTVSGNRLHHASAQAEPATDLSVQLSHLDSLLAGFSPSPIPGPPPLCFTRENDFKNTLFGKLVPPVGFGMGPAQY